MDIAYPRNHVNNPQRAAVWAGMLLVCGYLGLPASATPPEIAWFRMRTPGDTHDIQQGSDLCWGRIGQRAGLWTCSDRNGEHSAGRIYLFSPETLQKARPGQRVVADEEFTLHVPPEEWEGFVLANRAADPSLLDDLRRRMRPDADRGEEPYLDLEGLTIAPSLNPPGETHLFAVAEEPFSAILELAIEGEPPGGRARVVAVYAYREAPHEQGTARNDGLEGIAWAGRPGLFYIAEEGTRDHRGAETALLLFADPRLGLAELRDCGVHVRPAVSDALTAAIRAQRSGSMQTLNGLCRLANGQILALDRNGGWILWVDPQTQSARPWLNLYDVDGQDLRKILANVPRQRRMPYVSIEGLAVDDAGDLWLVDDPAIPEGFRESVLLRIRVPELRAATHPAADGPTQ